MLETLVKRLKDAATITLVVGSALLYPIVGCDKGPTGPDLAGPPRIWHTSVPAFGSYDDLKGKVAGVEPSGHRVSTYIYVGGQWWMKPYWDRPLTAISENGEWTTDITTGGIDQKATAINSYLVTSGYVPVSHVLPDTADALVLAMCSSER
ncbi:hypothetical protein JXB02_01290 [Candidatus Woesearchaeota archaeon]|nr:hypothetical protein [Candidatus Woesearchaeota archaeon]